MCSPILLLFFVHIIGTRNGTIARHELPTYPDNCHWACQGKAWFDEEIMLEWVEMVLKPYLLGAPRYIVPFLILLDSFKVHMLGSAVKAIQALGAEVEFIPPGCTGLVQTMDVGFNKPFKAKLHAQFSKWMMCQDPDQPTPAASHRDVAGWIMEAEREVCDETICNAWKKTGFSYFPNQSKE